MREMEERVEEALRTQETYADNEVTPQDIARENGFRPCKIKQVKTLSSSEFNSLSKEDFDEDYCYLCSGFSFFNNTRFNELSRYRTELPNLDCKVVSLRYELVGSDEDWSMREFWSKDKFPRKSYLRASAESNIGDLIGSIVPIVSTPKRIKRGPTPDYRKYKIASLAADNTMISDVKEYDVPSHTVDTKFEIHNVVLCSLLFSTLFIPAMVFVDHIFVSNEMIEMIFQISIGLSGWVVTNWAYKNLFSKTVLMSIADRIHGVELPSNPYHNQFESTRQFIRKTTI